MPSLSEAATIALLPVLEPGEQVEQIARAVGCSLVLTDRRLLPRPHGPTAAARP
jgi:hypothetical protein